MKLLVRVTPKMIAVGKRREAFSCPIARAFKSHRRYVEETEVSPGRVIVYFQKNRQNLGWLSIDNPPDLQDRIIGFDETGHMEPFEFEVEVPLERGDFNLES